MTSLFDTKDLEVYKLEDLKVEPKEVMKKGKTVDELEVWEKYQDDKKALEFLKMHLKGSPLLLIKDCRMKRQQQQPEQMPLHIIC